jgi:hypothetical protein
VSPASGRKQPKSQIWIQIFEFPLVRVRLSSFGAGNGTHNQALDDSKVAEPSNGHEVSALSEVTPMVLTVQVGFNSDFGVQISYLGHGKGTFSCPNE